MSKAPQAETAPESDVFEGAPHPRFAARLIGHRAAELAILESFKAGRLAHAWLIGGPEGIGKATLAWRMARFALANPHAPTVQRAEDLSVDPQSLASRMLSAGSHPDFRILRRAWDVKAKRFKTEIAKDDIDEALALFHKSAGAGGWRVVLLDCAEALNRNGANALLKMIEEPPERALILIVAHRPGQTLATIRSRCRKLLLSPLSAADVSAVIAGLGEPWSGLDAAARASAARASNGSVREALRALDPSSAGVSALIAATLALLPHADASAVHRLADALGARAAGDAFEAFNLAIFDWLAERARAPRPTTRPETIALLWERLRASARETDALNLDRKLHVLSAFAEIAALGGQL